MKNLNENLELIPHITLDPTDARMERTKAQANALSKYWSKLYSSVHIKGIYKPEIKMWIVPVRHVTDERTIHELLTVVVQDILEDERDLDTIMMSIHGGLSLFHNGRLLYEAQCCADLTNIDDWKNILTYRDHEFTLMWNGHPMIPVRYYGGSLFFDEVSDYIPKSKGTEKHSISVEILKSAVEQASIEVKQFQKRVQDYWLTNHENILTSL